MFQAVGEIAGKAAVAIGEAAERMAEASVKAAEGAAETAEVCAKAAEGAAQTTEILAEAAEGAAQTTEISAEAAEGAAQTTEISAEAAEGTVQTTEISAKEADAAKETGTVVLEPDMALIRESSLKALQAANAERLSSPVEGEAAAEIVEKEAAENAGLSEEQKALILEETGWPQEIVDCIESMEQYEVYKNADLEYALIDGRPCLVKKIDWDYVDPDSGLTNRELVERKRVPIDAKTGEKIELHHMGQEFDSPFAELCENSEHGDGKDGILHDKGIESWRRNKECQAQYRAQRISHWKTRAASPNA